MGAANVVQPYSTDEPPSAATRRASETVTMVGVGGTPSKPTRPRRVHPNPSPNSAKKSPPPPPSAPLDSRRQSLVGTYYVIFFFLLFLFVMSLSLSLSLIHLLLPACML